MEGQAVDYDRIKRNISKMIAQDAPESDIDQYIASEGVTPAQLRQAKATIVDPEQARGVGGYEAIAGQTADPMTARQAGRNLLEGIPMAARAAGGIGGGMLGAPGGPVTAIGGAVLGSEGLGQLADIGVDYALGKPVKTPVQRGTEAITNMATDLGTQGVMAGAGSLLTKIRKGMVNTNAAKIMDDLRQAGIGQTGPTATAPMVGGRGVQRAAETTQKLYFGSDVWDGAIKNTQDDFAKSFERTRGRVGTATEKATGGDAVQTGIDSYAKRSGIIRDRLYNRVKGLNQLPVDIQETKAVANELLGRMEQGLGDSATETMLKDIVSRDDTVPFETAKQLRSDLLSIARQQNSLLAGKAESSGKLLAKTLDRNMETAGQTLDPSQFERFRKANVFNKTRAEALEAVDQVWKSDSAQQAFNAATQGAADGPAKILALKKVLPAEQWDEFRAVWLHQMGLESKGQAMEATRGFNPQSFLSNYAGMSPKSKEALFGGGNADLRNELDRLARIAGYIRDTRAMANPSGTAGSALSAAQMAGAGASALAMTQGSPSLGAVGVLLPTAGVYGTSKLMTSPRFVKWLADGARLPPADPNALRQHLTRLVTVGTLQPELREDIDEYLKSKRTTQ